MFCPKCGTQNGDGARSCSGCGAPLPQAPAGPTAAYGQTAPARRRRSKESAIIGMALAVVAVLVAALVVVPALHKNPFKGAKVGDMVQFGSYEQDGDESDGKESINWRVLAIDGNRAYVVSEKALTARAFNSSHDKGNDWDSSDLKAWLEGDFASEAFSADDKKIIDGGPTLLSVAEANQYFSSDDDRACYPTQQAVNDGARTSDFGACYWWLRSPGSRSRYELEVSVDGFASSHSYGSVDDSGASVRPAMWVNL